MSDVLPDPVEEVKDIEQSTQQKLTPPIKKPIVEGSGINATLPSFISNLKKVFIDFEIEKIRIFGGDIEESLKKDTRLQKAIEKMSEELGEQVKKYILAQLITVKTTVNNASVIPAPGYAVPPGGLLTGVSQGTATTLNNQPGPANVVIK